LKAIVTAPSEPVKYEKAQDGGKARIRLFWHCFREAALPLSGLNPAPVLLQFALNTVDSTNSAETGAQEPFLDHGNSRKNQDYSNIFESIYNEAASIHE
jgi:hypothetical protein